MKGGKAVGNEAASIFGSEGRHPLTHRTETVGYAVLAQALKRA